MARWGDHRDRAEAAQQRITVDHGYIDLSLPALVRAERTARAVPTSAAERTAAQEYTKARGYEHRQLRILPPTCAKVNTRYQWKLVGDSPELYCGLDSHGFADLDAAVTLNCSLATY